MMVVDERVCVVKGRHTAEITMLLGWLVPQMRAFSILLFP